MNIRTLVKLTMMSLLLTMSSAVHASDKMAADFAKPPQEAKPWVLWFPINGNLTKEGITADLEAMARVGLGGLLCMEVNQGAPDGPASFAGPLWRELFQHTCREAKRLGLQINMNNDAGWCGSGGPWITPELSMQKVVWSETRVEGGKLFEGVLARPKAEENFYRDIAVLAMPVPEAEQTDLAEAGAVITASVAAEAASQKPKEGTSGPVFSLPRPEPQKPQFVQVEFPRPYRATEFRARLDQEHVVNGELQVSEDGKSFRAVRQALCRSGEVVVRFEPVSGRVFRFLFRKVPDDKKPDLTATDTGLTITDIRMSSVYRLDMYESKSSVTMGHLSAAPAQYPMLPAENLVPHDQVIDLTSQMDAAGKLTWQAPSGRWVILRFGHTSTGVDNHPAPEAGRGLECDKLSKEAAAAHYQGLMSKLVADNKALAGQGKVLVAMHIDSWEVGSQNWTPKMREDFKRLRGYDPLPLLPIFTGRVLDSVEFSERFLWDLRQTVSDLLVENYAGELRRLANKDGLRLSIEGYTAPAEQLRYASEADEPMGEFLSWDKFQNAWSCTEMASAAHIYGKRIMGAEAFTAKSSEKWLGHPGNIKDLGDWAFCEGINRFVFHRFAAQPWTNRAPGMSMGHWGLHYERTQTWWEQSKPWHEYLSRCQYLLRQGLFVADVLYLKEEGAPSSFKAPVDAEIAPHVRGGYNFDGCSPDALLTRVSVKEGRLVLPDGMSYRLLVLPKVETMTPRLLEKIKQLADAGALILGNKTPPKKSPSFGDLGEGDAKVQQLAAALWPKIITGKTVAEVLGSRGVVPDFQAQPILRYIHRQTEEADLYFVANPEAKEVTAQAAFRVSGKLPEFWWPDTGRMEPARAFEEKDGVTRVPMRLEPSGSVFVVFRKKITAHKPEAAGGATNWLEFKPMQEITGPWEVSFDPKWGGPAQVSFDQLEDWSKRPEEGIKYYSGTAVYRKTFSFQSEATSPRTFLDLGKVAVMAEVKLNGKDLGILWKSPYRVEVTSALKKGENRLEVKVVNLWVNRLIGDEQLPEDSERRPDGTLRTWPTWLTEGKPSPTGRYAFTTYRLWKKGDALVESGLLGPVRVMGAK